MAPVLCVARLSVAPAVPQPRRGTVARACCADPIRAGKKALSHLENRR